MEPVRVQRLMSARLDLPAAPLTFAGLVDGGLVVLCDGLRPGTLLVCTFAAPDPAAPTAPRRARGLVQLAGSPEAATLRVHPRRSFVHVACASPEGASLYGIDVAVHQPSFRLALEALPADLVRMDDRLAFVDPGDVVNVVDADGHDIMTHRVKDPITALAAHPDGGLVLGTRCGELIWLDLRGEVRATLAIDAPVAGLAVNERGRIVAHDGERLWAWSSAQRPELSGLTVGPMKGAPAVDARGAIFVLHGEHGIWRVDGRKRAGLHWAEGLTCSAPALDYSGAMVVAAHAEGVSALLAWPPTPPGRRRPWPAATLELPARAIAIEQGPLSVMVLCEDGQLLEGRITI